MAYYLSPDVTIATANVLAEGDVLITFSDDTTVLYTAPLLYDARNSAGAIRIVAPFEN
jgi:hypothetical protein